MKKLIWVLLFLSACTCKVRAELDKKCREVCKENGGMKRIDESYMEVLDPCACKSPAIMFYDFRQHDLECARLCAVNGGVDIIPDEVIEQRKAEIRKIHEQRVACQDYMICECMNGGQVILTR